MISKSLYPINDRLFWILASVIIATAISLTTTHPHWFVVVEGAKQGGYVGAAFLAKHIFLLLPFGLTFAVPYVIGLAMPGPKSLLPVAVTALVMAAFWVRNFISGDLEYMFLSVRDAYVMHRLMLPTTLGLVAGVLIRALQLRHAYPRLQPASIALLVLGMLIPQAPVVSAFGSSV